MIHHRQHSGLKPLTVYLGDVPRKAQFDAVCDNGNPHWALAGAQLKLQPVLRISQPGFVRRARLGKTNRQVILISWVNGQAIIGHIHKICDFGIAA